MYAGLPISQIHLLRCPNDAGVLTIAARRDSASSDRIMNGVLQCEACRRQYHIVGGILSLLDDRALDEESAHERRLRDDGAELEYELSIADPVDSAMEMRPTLALLQPRRQGVVVELGCGTGRYTLPIAADCAALLAVDFSLEELRILARRVTAEMPVGLVNADITRLRLAPARFDWCLSTLVSNLPSARHREAMLRLASEALKDDGGFVFSTHFYGLPELLKNMPQAGRYNEGGIYRYHCRKSEIVRETVQYFDKVRARPIKVIWPLVGRRVGWRPTLSRFSERLPLLNQFGRLLLVSARKAPPRATR
jgi:SAM-dependent methyltransferase